MRGWGAVVMIFLAGIFLAGCAVIPEQAGTGLIEVARSDRQWTGVAISRESRMFVSYPLWGEEASSVWEVLASGEIRPYPEAGWNVWEPGLPPAEHFVCVQSLFIDGRNRLWILDPANPRFQGVVAGGAKLLEVNLEENKVVSTILFDEEVAPENSYLNEVRVDPDREYAYITDSGTGALVVVNLATGKSRRLLANHSSTRGEGVNPVVEGREWKPQEGRLPLGHADGLGLTPDGEDLYYGALTGRTLYRIATRWLRDEALPASTIAGKVQFVDTIGPAASMIFGPGGRLYFAAIEENAVKSYTPGGRIETAAVDPELKWPDSLALGPDDFIFVTTSRLHLGFSGPGPYRLFKFRPRLD